MRQRSPPRRERQASAAIPSNSRKSSRAARTGGASLVGRGKKFPEWRPQVDPSWNDPPFLAGEQPFPEKFRDRVGIASLAFQRTLPNHRNPPARMPENGDVTAIPGDVRVELLAPESHVGRGRRGRLAAVSMPETAMDEHDRLESGKDDIRRTRQSLVVKAIAQSDFMQ